MNGHANLAHLFAPFDTLDYALESGNYSANNRPEANHHGVARLSFEKLD